jgi:ABC-type nitrate/sulfonate/bicarbonate transport system permease component
MAVMDTDAGAPRAADVEAPFKRWLLAHPGAARIGVIALLVGIWEFAARFLLDRDFISPPSVVLMSFGALFATPGVPKALALTLYEIAVGFALASLIGVTVGLAVGLGRFTHKSFMPIILLLYGLPQITILPLFVLMFGIGAASKIAFGVTHGMFPIMIAVAAGVQKINPVLMRSARSMGANSAHILYHVIFPHMVPSFFTGLRLGMTGVLLGVLLAELYVSTAGIGYFTSLFTQNLQPAKLIALVSMLALIAVLLNTIVRRAETHYGRWRA